MIIESIKSEFLRYKNLTEGAITQIDDEVLYQIFGEEGNSIAIIMNHLSGNLISRFTDFFTSDGEKPWRHRDKEFDEIEVSRDELVRRWNQGWSVLWGQLEGLTDNQAQSLITIRGMKLTVIEALHRSLAHYSYHVGQIVFIAKYNLGKNWRSLSIPRGKSEIYNENPGKEKGKLP
jgi:uncharacterized damage-inducible protein DinB